MSFMTTITFSAFEWRLMILTARYVEDEIPTETW